MISPKSYEKEWILAQSKHLGNTGPEILNVLLAASRSAYITSIIQTGKLEEFKLFDNSTPIGDYLFSEKPENQLNKLSKLPGGVLYYLKRAYDLTK